MRNRFRSDRLAAFTARTLVLAATVVAVPRLAAAQSAGPDVAVVSPNVMLLIDTSGSMELKASGASVPACVPGTPNTGVPSDPNEKSRWVNLMEVLSGSIENYSCFAESKSSPEFLQEYSLGPTALLPRDAKDSDDYHRPLSNGCAPGPGDLPTGAPWGWPAAPLSAIKYRPYMAGTISPVSTCAAGTWGQTNDGLLNSFDGLLRFGLMTFDTEADPGTGVSGPATPYGFIDDPVDYRNGIRGAWSYYLTTSNTGCRHPATSSAQCQTAYPDGTTTDDVAGCCMGGPINCTVLSPFEVGARNAAAPPWEGRMVAFGPSSEDGTKRNDWIQDVVRASRPFGATPIAGMLSDARDFFWNDDTLDPLDKATGEKFGPATDPQVVNSCRQNYIVLLTDGEPNMDLRTPCEGLGTDKCPFDRSDEIVADLANSTNTARKPVRTFVVGFALDQANVNGVPTDCRTLDPTDPACANPTDQALRTCCTLNSIAFNGTPTALQHDTTPGAIKYALFPQNAQDLRTALSQVLSQAGSNAASRTYPVTATAALSDPTKIDGFKPAAYEITSGAQPKAGWKGILARQRFNCDNTQTSTPQAVDSSKGDDFIATVNNSPLARTMFTVEPPGSPVGWDPTHSIRPYFTDVSLDDGIHFEDGVQSDFKDPTSMKGVISVQAMKGVTAATCGTATAATCKDRIVDYMVGLPSASPLSRCNLSNCNVVGDIFHSVPQVVNGVPSEFLRDPTYTAFAASLAKRDAMVYTSTNDGFFHGFWLTPGDGNPNRIVDSMKNPPNESFAFVPPAVLPYFAAMYPTAGATATQLRSLPVNRIPALDGVPVIRDVGATKDGSRALNNNAASNQYFPYRLERKKAPASGESHTWRTVMAQAFGPLQGGYFALDVTTPFVDKTLTDKSTGPKFLWQLTTDTAGQQIFGKSTPTPLITTLFVDLKALGGPSTSDPPLEVPVAVLPGGQGGAPSPSNLGCGNNPPTSYITQDGATASATRSKLRCYEGSPDSLAARSLTIVRLDNGQILRTFRPILPVPQVQPVTFDAKVLTLVDIQAPIVGQPAAFPSQAGQIADRIFVGDAEGRMWRIDVSKPDPAAWTMQPFFDPFYDLAVPGLVPPQPVQTAPVLSVDGKGQITVAFSTGDQDNVTPDPNHKNYVVSVTETVFTNTSSGNREFHAQMNWRKEFTGGEHVLGPMSLFDRTLYYSTFSQPTGSKTCEPGTSTIAGVDYLAPAGTPETDGGVVRLTTPITFAGPVISGVALRQQPACAATTAAQASGDDFLGYGQTTSVSTVNPGVFELVVQKSGSAIPTTTSVSVPTAKAPIPVPRLQVRVDSWAPIIE